MQKHISEGKALIGRRCRLFNPYYKEPVVCFNIPEDINTKKSNKKKQIGMEGNTQELSPKDERKNLAELFLIYYICTKLK